MMIYILRRSVQHTLFHKFLIHLSMPCWYYEAACKTVLHATIVSWSPSLLFIVCVRASFRCSVSTGIHNTPEYSIGYIKHTDDRARNSAPPYMTRLLFARCFDIGCGTPQHLDTHANPCVNDTARQRHVCGLCCAIGLNNPLQATAGLWAIISEGGRDSARRH